MGTTSTNDRILGLNEFFAASEARVDRWRTLNRVAKALAGTGGRPAGGQDPKALLAELAPLEELCGYPGPRLMAQVHERLQTGDCDGLRAPGAADQRRAPLRTATATTRSPGRRTRRARPDCPTSCRRRSVGVRAAGRTSRSCSSRRPSGRCGRRSGRPSGGCGASEDEFVYEPVVVGSFEDAVLAVVFNPNLQAVVISDGFVFPSQSHGAGAARDPHPPGAGRRGRAERRSRDPPRRGWCAGGGRSSTST